MPSVLEDPAPPNPLQTPPLKTSTYTFTTAAVLFSQPTTGPEAVVTIAALSAAPVPLKPDAPREVPNATHPPAPPFAVGSYFAARISLAVALELNSVQTTIG